MDLNARYQRKYYDQQILDLKYEVSQSYFSCVKALKQIEINSERLKQSENSLLIARKKFDAGLIPEAEVLKLDVDYGRENAKFESSKSLYQSEIDRLKNILGIDLMSTIEIDTSIAVSPVEYDLETLIETALQNRSEIDLKTISIQSLGLDIQGIRKINRPYGEFYGYGALKSTGEKFDDTFSDLQDASRIGVNFIVPIWDGGKNNILYKKDLLELEKAKMDLAKIKREVVLSVKEAYRNAMEAENLIRIHQANLQLAKKNNSISQERFSIGTITSQELLDSQVALSSVQTDFLNAQIDYKLALAYLQKVTNCADEH
jgi:outer membrane protein